MKHPTWVLFDISMSLFGSSKPKEVKKVGVDAHPEKYADQTDYLAAKRAGKNKKGSK